MIIIKLQVGLSKLVHGLPLNTYVVIAVEIARHIIYDLELRIGVSQAPKGGKHPYGA